MAERPAPIPFTLLTGFLGAGKTTLLNRLLRDPALADAAVVVNEAGEIGVDHLLVEHVADGVVALAGGCLCCSLRGDLIATLEDLLRARDNGRIPPFRRIVLETSGLADPVPVLQTLTLHPYLAMRYRLEGVVAALDAVAGPETVAERPEAARQVAMADHVVLSKTDLATAEQVVAARALVARLAPAATLQDAGALNVAALLAPSLGIKPSLEVLPEAHGAVRTIAMASEAALSREAYDLFVELLRSAHAPKLLRLKGLIRIVGDERPLVVQGVRHVFAEPRFLENWPDGDVRTRLVAIGEDLAPDLLPRLYAAFAGTVAPDRPDRAALMENPLSLRTGGLLG
ncbi:CobW family GTP-binding protein [Hansschlegelia quercus]|uniref:GTP-binding protein n=1 Tax=Hansschlegelia quercus TaxID=2528245 RepID=A0A4Q9GH33_9HYPH|nr:GTP-binding protein [Hansschlegelia quercus]TBN53443.1 GTP-binding protein [Hansschlegelia quercus]